MRRCVEILDFATLLVFRNQGKHHALGDALLGPGDFCDTGITRLLSLKLDSNPIDDFVLAAVNHVFEELNHVAAGQTWVPNSTLVNGNMN